MKKFYIFLALLIFFIAVFLYNRNHSEFPISPTNKLTEQEAREIAEGECIKGGDALSKGVYNNVDKSWSFQANLNVKKPGCESICVVYEGLKPGDPALPELNWECEEPSENEDLGKVFCNPEDRKAESCTKIYKPVCATVNVQCIKAPCDPVSETYGNSCEACSNTLVESYREGGCADNSIKKDTPEITK